MQKKAIVKSKCRIDRNTGIEPRTVAEFAFVQSDVMGTIGFFEKSQREGGCPKEENIFE
jgi:hypothetical protein